MFVGTSVLSCSQTVPSKDPVDQNWEQNQTHPGLAETVVMSELPQCFAQKEDD